MVYEGYTLVTDQTRFSKCSIVNKNYMLSHFHHTQVFDKGGFGIKLVWTVVVFSQVYLRFWPYISPGKRRVLYYVGLTIAVCFSDMPQILTICKSWGKEGLVLFLSQEIKWMTANMLWKELPCTGTVQLIFICFIVQILCNLVFK